MTSTALSGEALAHELRRTTQEMARRVSVPMDLWCEHSNACLQAATFIERTASEPAGISSPLRSDAPSAQVTEQMVERAARVMWPYWETMMPRDRASAMAIMRPCLAAALNGRS